MAALSLLFAFSDLDLAAARLFYSPVEPHWFGQSAAPWSWLYRFGPLPATIVGVLGMLAWLWSFADETKKSWRGPGLYLFLLLLLGPGLLVNGLAKNLAGRPRPSEILEFGGAWEFRRAFDFGIPGRGKAFISGHASNAFYWFCLYFLAPRSRRPWAFAAALAFGLAMSFARMSQGGHFLSDNLLCASLIFTLAAGLSPLIHWQPRADFFKRGDIAKAGMLGLGGWLAISNPIYEERHFRWAVAGQAAKPESPTERAYEWNQAEDPGAYNLQCEVLGGEIRADFDANPSILGELPFSLEERFSADALPLAKERFEPRPLASSPAWPMKAGDFGIAVIQRISGPFWGAQGAFLAHLSAEKPCELRLKSKSGGITIGTLPKNSQVLVYGNFPASSLPLGFEAYGMNGFHRPGSGALVVLHLEAPQIHFDTNGDQEP